MTTKLYLHEAANRPYYDELDSPAVAKRHQESQVLPLPILEQAVSLDIPVPAAETTEADNIGNNITVLPALPGELPSDLNMFGAEAAFNAHVSQAIQAARSHLL